MEGLLDTGATTTMLSPRLAERIGVEARSNGASVRGIGGPAFTVKDGSATVCLPGRCGCRKVKALVHGSDRAMGDLECIVGMDYLAEAEAKIEAATGKLRCACAGTKHQGRRVR